MSVKTAIAKLDDVRANIVADLTPEELGELYRASLAIANAAWLALYQHRAEDRRKANSPWGDSNTKAA